MEKAYLRPVAQPVVPQEFVAHLAAVFGQLFGQQQTGTPNWFPIASVVVPDRHDIARANYQRE
eukprot:4143559-Lingulodinium_polyedra.AAC.1